MTRSRIPGAEGLGGGHLRRPLDSPGGVRRLGPAAGSDADQKNCEQDGDVGTRRAPPGVGLARRSVTIEVTVSGPVWVPEAQSQGPVHPDMGEPDERHRHGQARAAEHTTQSQDSRGKVCVGQIVGHRTSPGAGQVSEKTQIRNREQCDEQPPRLPLPAVQDRRHGE